MTTLYDINTRNRRNESVDNEPTDMDRDFWLDPQGAIEYGLADKLMTPETWRTWVKARP